jgi:ABC-type transport system involved in multi-copper enzyme maturation permease subunit
MEPQAPAAEPVTLLDQLWLKPIWLIELLPEGWGVWAVPFYMGLLGLVVLLLAWLVLRYTVPRVAAVAYSTAKEGWSQPLFLLLVVLGVFLLLVVFPFLPYNTFGEDVKVVKDTGLTLIMVLGILLAVWTASVSVADEIEGRTAVTLLSKPISRRGFVIGKLLGVIGPVALLFIILGTVFLFSVCFKVGYDSRENYVTMTEVARIDQMTSLVPGLILSFYEAMIMASIAVAISTRLGWLPNILICGAVYALGHIMPVVVQSGGKSPEQVQFVAKLLNVILPNLDHFSMQTAVATDRLVPVEVLAWVGLYALLYITMMTFLALLLFEDRDLA